MSQRRTRIRPCSCASCSLLRDERNARGLHDTIVGASDQNKDREATSTWTSFSSETKSMVGRVNVHGCEQDDTRGTQRRRLYEAMRHDKNPDEHGKMALWQTEYGEGYDNGLPLAYNLSLDMRYL